MSQDKPEVGDHLLDYDKAKAIWEAAMEAAQDVPGDGADAEAINTISYQVDKLFKKAMHEARQEFADILRCDAETLERNGMIEKARGLRRGVWLILEVEGPNAEFRHEALVKRTKEDEKAGFWKLAKEVHDHWAGGYESFAVDAIKDFFLTFSGAKK